MTSSFVRGLLVAAFAHAGLSACSSSSSGAAHTCTMQMSGIVSATVAASDACVAAVERSGDGGRPGDEDFVLTASVPGLSNLGVLIHLGSSRVPVTLSSDIATGWSALAVTGGASSECVLGGGANAVPAGSFSLSLTSGGPDDGAGRTVAHGLLSLVLYMHAPPSTECGAGDVEELAIAF